MYILCTQMYRKGGPIRQKKRPHSCRGSLMLQISATLDLTGLDGLKGSYTDKRLSVTENNGNRVINEATMVTPSKLKGGIFTLRGSETAQNDR